VHSSKISQVNVILALLYQLSGEGLYYFSRDSVIGLG